MHTPHPYEPPPPPDAHASGAPPWAYGGRAAAGYGGQPPEPEPYGGREPGSAGGTGAEWLVPVRVPVIPVATTPWTGDWFGSGPADAVPVTPVSVAVLPGGTVHTWGTVMSQARGLADDTHPAWSAAAWQARETGRATHVAVGHPDGRVERLLVEADGTAHPAPRPAPPLPARRPPDPCWGDPARMPHDLCALAPGADTDPAAALGRAAGDAARDGDWPAATHYATVAAARLHAQGAFAGADKAARLAVTSWLRTTDTPDTAALGFSLVHLLISTLPTLQGPIAALLRRLADHLPAAPR